jgi:hypothetical protein
VAGDVIAWEATIGGARAVRVRWGSGGAATVTGSFDHAGEPRAARDGVVMTGWLGSDDASDADIDLVKAGEAEAMAIAAGPGQQRFADISEAHVAYTDFAEDPDGRFDENASDLADVALYERATGTTTLRPREGKQAFPLLGGVGSIVYLGWGPTHPEPKFSDYVLLVGDIAEGGAGDALAASIVTQAPYIRPAARGDRLEWIEWPTGNTASLHRRPIDLSAPAETIPDLVGLELFGPSASASITIVGARAPGEAMGLRAIAR